MALFQNALLNKYLRSLDEKEIKEKYILFTSHFHNPVVQENIRNSKEEQYQEGFLSDLFEKILGYTKNPQPNYDLTTELKNVKDSKKVDGAIIINNIPIAVIELKGMDTTDLKSVEDQAFRYKNNQKECNYVITSNFQKLRFYIDNAVEYLEFNLFTLSEDDFKILYLCLAKQYLSKDLPKTLKNESITKEDSITKQLYEDYSTFKRELFQNLLKNNPQFDRLLLFKKSQKLLDRFLFLFFAEDRSLLQANSVRTIIKRWEQASSIDLYYPLFEGYKRYFGYLNTGYDSKDLLVYAYNGGLFAPDEVLDQVIIDDDVLKENTIKLSDYDFASEVDVNILGHIFENSLNEIEEVQAEITGEIIEKSKTKRKKDGVFYTPKYITKYIIESTIGKLCALKKAELQINDEEMLLEGKKIIDISLKTKEKNKAKKEQKIRRSLLKNKIDTYRNWLLQITICDPACGSGAFLNQALEFLIQEHQYIDELEANLFGDAIVLTDITASILENNLYGVDINEESIEIAKLSLWLRTAEPNRKLTSLSNNLKCGNSLIVNKDVAGEKAFNWQKEFPNVFVNGGGFDVVIGNPPYVDIKSLSPSDVKFYFETYNTCENRINLYSIFIEKGYSILKKGGILSYINPNSMLMNTSYNKLRELIWNDLTKIIKLPDNVFDDANVETIIIEVEKEISEKSVKVINYKRTDIIDSIDNQLITIFSKEKWKDGVFNIYITENIQKVIQKIKLDTVPLENIAIFSLGITPYDKYRGHSQDIIKTKAYHSEYKLNNNYQPLIGGENIKRYTVESTVKEYILYGDWLGAKRDERFFTEERLLIRQIISGKPGRIYCGYTDENLYFTQIGFGLILNNIEYYSKYILCLMNSLLINFYHKYVFLDLEKEIFQKILIANCKKFPIKKTSIENQSRFVEKANYILELNNNIEHNCSKLLKLLISEFNLIDTSKKLNEWYNLDFSDFIKELKKKKIELTLSQKVEWMDFFEKEKAKISLLLNEIQQTDREIDKMVYEIYELTQEEIRIIESNK
ncbi:Eco57I restriction-modification methylase domain-containing protein [Myroides odoratimimus]|uniref:Eco57I restriction-modification methylase domain-containing protein n=1 Tax=Myroides odoratimimus TaxID=76832 RepID=UPI00091D2439|nr:N-6 DNA methylase [Myroides odoratimimus]SHM20513.1 Type I restriction enzyme R protein N terminus (HSDR_N) [Myroides odoratimimus subsp. xuanwuensis]